jgi:hypothetical protein
MHTFLLVALLTASLIASEPTLQPVSGFSTEGGAFVLRQGEGGALQSSGPLAPGPWLVRGEIRCQGFGHAGMVAIDVLAVGREATLSPYSSTTGSADWAPIALSFRVEQSEAVTLRVAHWRNTEANATLQLRNVTLQPFPFKSPNWLVSGTWDIGRPGEMPVGWEWKGAQVPQAGSIALIKNTSFKTGKHVLLLRGGAEARILAYPEMPMPPSGEVEFSAWVRSIGAAKRPLNLWLYGQGWNPRITCGGDATETWQRLSGVLAVIPEKKELGVLIELPAGAGDVELADVRLTWHAEGLRK